MPTVTWKVRGCLTVRTGSESSRFLARGICNVPCSVPPGTRGHPRLRVKTPLTGFGRWGWCFFKHAFLLNGISAALSHLKKLLRRMRACLNFRDT